MIRLLICLALMASPIAARVTEGHSDDPLTELNALYGKICKWDADVTIPVEEVKFTDDGVPDYLLTYDLSCRGQANAFSGTMGMARQIWISTPDGYRRIMDVNARGLEIERRDQGLFVILQHAGGFCLNADSTPCFLTLEFKDNQLVWAAPDQHHPSMKARLERQAQEEKTE